MPIDSSNASPVNPSDRSRTLADRVKTRVEQARLHLDNGTGESKPPRKKRASQPIASLGSSSEADRELRSLRKVYCEMRGLYRRYRRESGSAAVPELRSAVHAFRRGESLASLTHIAAFLDDRKLLSW